MKTFVRTIMVAGLFLAAAPALAHHGWSGYRDGVFTLNGIVEAVHLGQPHGRLDVRVEDQLWNVVLGPPFRNSRAGIDEGVIEIGDEITAHGQRHTDPSVLEMKTEWLEREGKVFDIYPSRH